MLSRLFLPALAGLLLLAAGVGPAAAAEPLDAAQKKAVEQMIHDYLLNNPEVLIEALHNAQKASEAKAAAAIRQTIAEKRGQLVNDPDTPVGGNPDGDVTIVEFFDYNCPYCKQVEPALEALLTEDRKLRIAYKEFPILGRSSVYAARAALAARKQGKYDAFHRAMMAAKGPIDDEVVLHVAASVGLDLERLKKDMASAEVETLIRRNLDLAEAIDIQATPTFIVGEQVTPGADIDALREQIAALRKAARKPG